jgi:2'-5' RNA ligase
MRTADLPEMVRAFIAIELPEQLVLALGEVQKRLQTAIPPATVRWVPPDQMHLTLKFLGNIASARLEELEAALRKACVETSPLTLRAEGLGCFPGPSHPRVIWVGVEGDLEALKALQARIDPITEEWCDRDEKRSFRPHLTIGRLKEISPRAARKIGTEIKSTELRTLGIWKVEQVKLMRSKLSPKGAEHTVLASFPFFGNVAAL